VTSVPIKTLIASDENRQGPQQPERELLLQIRDQDAKPCLSTHEFRVALRASSERKKAMLLLDEGYWAASSCLERGGWRIVIAIAAFIALLFLGLLKARIQDGPLKNEIQIPYANKLALYSILGLGLITFLALGTAIATARTRTLLFVENGVVVETGCVRLTAYEDRFAQENLTISYRYKESKNDENRHLLVLRPSPSSRTLTVEIKNTKYPANLAEIAPDAVRAYLEKAKELNSSIPAEFKNL
jgi:hypothetical protein